MHENLRCFFSFFILLGAEEQISFSYQSKYIILNSCAPNCKPKNVICMCKKYPEYNIWSNVKTLWIIKSTL